MDDDLAGALEYFCEDQAALAQKESLEKIHQEAYFFYEQGYFFRDLFEDVKKTLDKIRRKSDIETETLEKVLKMEISPFTASIDFIAEHLLNNFKDKLPYEKEIRIQLYEALSQLQTKTFTFDPEFIQIRVFVADIVLYLISTLTEYEDKLIEKQIAYSNGEIRLGRFDIGMNDGDNRNYDYYEVFRIFDEYFWHILENRKIYYHLHNVGQNVRYDLYETIAKFSTGSIYEKRFQDKLRGDLKKKYDLDVKEKPMNPKYNRIYGPGNIHWKGNLEDGKDRGGEPYYCPVGWKKYSVGEYKDAKEFDEKFKGWFISYHGTQNTYAGAILSTGLRASSYQDNKFKTNAAYLSPCISYCAHPRYARPWKRTNDNKYVQMVLQCRINPEGMIGKREATLLASQNKVIDGNYKNETMEWLVSAKGEDIGKYIVCYGIMLRVTDVEPDELPESEWWKECHSHFSISPYY
jgi:hypothetical protein